MSDAHALPAGAPPYALRLRDAVDAAEPRLLALDDVRSALRPAPGKWSPREVIGHLVDSASNNHGRFVRAAQQDDMVFAGYAQDGWVELQRYDEAPWPGLVALWAGFNRHLARVMALVPDEARTRPRARHNLHEVAWGTLPPDLPATLGWFMNDYVRHLEHHLRQALGPGWKARES